jgi:hypothetical protein
MRYYPILHLDTNIVKEQLAVINDIRDNPTLHLDID